MKIKIIENLETVLQSWKNHDTSYIKEVLSEDVVYESQWIYYPIHGKSNVINYLDVFFDAFEEGIRMGEIDFSVEIKQMDNENTIQMNRKVFGKDFKTLLIITIDENGLITKIGNTPKNQVFTEEKSMNGAGFETIEEFETVGLCSEYVKEACPDAYFFEPYYDNCIIGFDVFNEQVVYDMQKLVFMRMYVQNDVELRFIDCNFRHWFWEHYIDYMFHKGEYFSKKEGKNIPICMHDNDMVELFLPPIS